MSGIITFRTLWKLYTQKGLKIYKPVMCFLGNTTQTATALASVAQLVGALSRNQTVVGLIPS